MTTITAFIKRHPLPTYFALTFVISWGGILLTDNIAALLLLGVTAGLVASCFEEIGWTGFALPRLRFPHGVLAAGNEIGLLWGARHFLVDFRALAGSYGSLFLTYLLLFRVLALLAFRVLMVWVSERTGSLLLALLMHASFAAGLLILSPPVASGEHS